MEKLVGRYIVAMKRGFLIYTLHWRCCVIDVDQSIGVEELNFRVKSPSKFVCLVFT